MVIVKVQHPSLQPQRSRDWGMGFIAGLILFAMFYATFHIGRNYERETARREGYEEGFVQVAEDVKHNWECVWPTDACLGIFSDITDY